MMFEQRAGPGRGQTAFAIFSARRFDQPNRILAMIAAYFAHPVQERVFFEVRSLVITHDHRLQKFSFGILTHNLRPAVLGNINYGATTPCSKCIGNIYFEAMRVRALLEFQLDTVAKKMYYGRAYAKPPQAFFCVSDYASSPRRRERLFYCSKQNAQRREPLSNFVVLL